jgi:hypothetical protein
MRHAYRFAVVAVAALALSACSDDDEEFEAEMNGAAERPTPVDTQATGNATVTIEDTAVRVQGEFEGLSGAAVAAHIHGPADKETAAPIICPLTATAAVGGTLAGSCTFTEEQLQQLRDGRMYVNVHTQQHPQGEIRGQLE